LDLCLARPFFFGVEMELTVRFKKDAATIFGSRAVGDTVRLPHYEATRLAKEGVVEILDELPRGNTFGWIFGGIGNSMIR
jgi:hypothetical protein